SRSAARRRSAAGDVSPAPSIAPRLPAGTAGATVGVRDREARLPDARPQGAPPRIARDDRAVGGAGTGSPGGRRSTGGSRAAGVGAAPRPARRTARVPAPPLARVELSRDRGAPGHRARRREAAFEPGRQPPAPPARRRRGRIVTD